MKKIFVLLFFILATVAYSQKTINDLKPTVILISLDGFRYDYPDKFGTPNILKLAREGVRAKWMIPSFPTKTFPNHYTIATGLYPEHHGIVENNVYDFGEVFTIGNREKVQDGKWWYGEPIWVTAQKQGQIAASYFFVGSEAPIDGVLPKFRRTYNGKVPPEMRVDKALEWFDLPVNRRPTMITLYFSDTDDAGHEFSPDAEETKYAALNADRYIGRLMDGLRARGIDEKVNVIIVSDHGMASVDFRQKTLLDDYFDFDLAEKILWTNEIVQIFPNKGKTDEIYSKINKLEHTTCWKKENVPERLHYNVGKRIAPIICSSEEGWLTTSKKRYQDLIEDEEDLSQPHGAHGYDNKYQSMQATFIAHGAAFKKGYTAEPFENTNVYELMCEILKLRPAPNDGDLLNVSSMLKKPSSIRVKVKTD